MERESRKMTLDEAAEEAGGYVIPGGLDRGPHYRIRDLDHYCKAKGVEPTDLTPEELEQFRVK